MGVRRLTAFLETHQEIYHNALFGDNRLVIDGCDLVEGLYFDSGRDASRVRQFRGSVRFLAEQ